MFNESNLRAYLFLRLSARIANLKISYILLIIFIRYFIVFIRLIQRPLLASIMLIGISMIIRILISSLTGKWIRYLIILLFLGGIMVLFVYICTLISNVKRFIKSYSQIIFYFFIPALGLRLFLFFQPRSINFELKQLIISGLYVKSRFLLIILCISYLLIVLTISVKLSQKFKGGLKSKSYDI